MLIKILIENYSVSEELSCEHGFSAYIESQACKLLFDSGASNLFQKNAKKMDVKISDIDFMIISHGHYDHGGGLKSFLAENKKADVYVHRDAFGNFYALRSNNKFDYVGLDDKLKANKRLVFTSDRFFISHRVQVFSGVEEIEPVPILSKALLVEKDNDFVNDSFGHEQHLILDEGDKSLLMTGCAHMGIINVVEHYKKIRGKSPDYIVGGFHLSNQSQSNTESDYMVDKIGNYLLSTGAMCYTGHCTGLKPFERLKAILGDKIEYIKAGSLIEI